MTKNKQIRHALIDSITREDVAEYIKIFVRLFFKVGGRMRREKEASGHIACMMTECASYGGRQVLPVKCMIVSSFPYSSVVFYT